MTGQFRALLLQLESEHNRQLTEQAMAHAEEVAKLKDRIKELERKNALDHQIPPTPATGCRAERSQ